MATVVFFEKPGCINNTKQKKLLAMAGHVVFAKDLLSHPWTESELLSYMADLPVPSWFNPNAPAVTSGAVNPEDFTRETALEALLSNPLLIRRPLMEISGTKLVGFNLDAISQVAELPLSPTAELQNLMKDNLTDCPKKAENSQCD